MWLCWEKIIAFRVCVLFSSGLDRYNIEYTLGIRMCAYFCFSFALASLILPYIKRERVPYIKNMDWNTLSFSSKSTSELLKTAFILPFLVNRLLSLGALIGVNINDSWRKNNKTIQHTRNIPSIWCSSYGEHISVRLSLFLSLAMNLISDKTEN